jgi:ribosomal protein L11 methyltransferase
MTIKKSNQSWRQIVVPALDPDEADRVIAEAYAAGAVGLEEREGGDGVELILYAPGAASDAICASLAAAFPALKVGTPETVPDTDWSEQWKAGLKTTVISPRLAIRPSFIPAQDLPGQIELVIDPGQAFGTGSHPSTRLCLEWIDEIAPSLKPGSRVLDVGTGTGILSLGVCALSSADVFGFDLDPLAGEAARENARVNGLESRLRCFTGGLEAVGKQEFDLVVANMLRTEFIPLLEGIAARLRRGGHAVFSGLLTQESEEVRAALNDVDLRVIGERQLADADKLPWSALLTTH